VNKVIKSIVAVLVLAGLILLIFLSKENARKQSLYPAANSFPILEIINSASGKVYNRLVIESKEFAVEYIHSVNNSVVQEIFKVDGKNIKPAAVRFYSFGAGMQTELEEGQQMLRDGDAFIITGFNRSFTELNYIIDTASDHLLLLNGERISLRDLCGRNVRVTLRIHQRF
jgi:hypothetical protein